MAGDKKGRIDWEVETNKGQERWRQGDMMRQSKE